MSLIIGLTGGIGSGKSTAAKIFEELNIQVVDTDNIARLAVKPDQPAYEQIVFHFGKSILLPNGNINRALLRKIIFKDINNKRWIEDLLHPIIKKITSSQLNIPINTPYKILMSPLLIESKQYQLSQKILVIDIPVELQIQRSIQRDKISKEDAISIIESQISRNERLKYADDIIDNSKDFNCFKKQILKIHNKYLTLLQ